MACGHVCGIQLMMERRHNRAAGAFSSWIVRRNIRFRKWLERALQSPAHAQRCEHMQTPRSLYSNARNDFCVRNKEPDARAALLCGTVLRGRSRAGAVRRSVPRLLRRA